MINKLKTISFVGGTMKKVMLSTISIFLASISLNVNATLVRVEYSAEVYYTDATADIPIGTTITGSYLYNVADDLIQDLGAFTRHRFSPSSSTKSLININGIGYEDSYVDVNVADNTLSGGRDEIFFGAILSSINGTDWDWNLRLRDTATGTVGQLVTDDSLPSIDFYNSFPLGSASPIPPQAIIVGNVGNAFFVEAEVTALSAGVVPIPAAVWLFGSGLIGLIGVARRKKS